MLSDEINPWGDSQNIYPFHSRSRTSRTNVPSATIKSLGSRPQGRGCILSLKDASINNLRGGRTNCSWMIPALPGSRTSAQGTSLRKRSACKSLVYLVMPLQSCHPRVAHHCVCNHLPTTLRKGLVRYSIIWHPQRSILYIKVVQLERPRKV